MEAKRELIDLSVFEISLVDFPANEEEFAVIKQLHHQEDNTMSKVEETTVAETEETVEVTKEEVVAEASVEDAQPAEVEAAEASKAEGKKEEEVETEKSEETAAPDSQLTMADFDVEKFAERVAAATSVAVAKSLSEFTETFKSFMAPPVEAAEEVVEEKVEEPEAVIEKSLETKLNEIHEALTSVKVEKAEEKTEEVDVAKALSEIKKELSEVKAQVSDIENTQQPSTSVEPGADTDKEQAVEKSLWADVL